MNIPTTMQAIQFDQNRTITLVDLPIPEIGDDDVLVKSKVIGLCRSDIELLDGHLDAQLGISGPVIPGHEWAGEVVATGSKVEGFAPGDGVVGECVLSLNHWFGFDYPGAGSEYFRVPARLLHLLPPGINFHQGALIEPFTIAYKGIRTSGGCDGSDVVAIVGSGMVGLAALAIAAANGSETVVIEPSELRRDLATKLGATHTIDPNLTSPTQSVIENLTGRTGADLVIEASGSAPGLASTFSVAAHGGRILNIGICADGNVTAPLGQIQAKDLTVYGTTGSSEVWPAAIRFMQQHSIALDSVITSSYSIDQAHEAVTAANEPHNVKVHVEL